MRLHHHVHFSLLREDLKMLARKEFLGLVSTSAIEKSIMVMMSLHCTIPHPTLTPYPIPPLPHTSSHPHPIPHPTLTPYLIPPSPHTSSHPYPIPHPTLTPYLIPPLPHTSSRPYPIPHPTLIPPLPHTSHRISDSFTTSCAPAAITLCMLLEPCRSRCGHDFCQVSCAPCSLPSLTHVGRAGGKQPYAMQCKHLTSTTA